MARIPTPNFHDARLSVAQAAIREHVVKRSLGAAVSGLFPGHLMLQAANAVLQRIHHGEIDDAPAAADAYNAHRTGQAAQGAAVATPTDTPESCLDLLTHYVLAWVLDDKKRMEEIRSEWTDSPCDALGWLNAIDAWLAYYWHGSAPQYNPPVNAQGQGEPPFTSPGTFALPATPGRALRVGVLGDWGTGEPEAVAVLDQLMQQSPDVIIHVGDVYYAGTEDEQNTHFLQLINAARTRYGLNIPVYTLPGNHDYYSGGAGFYQMIKQLNTGVPNAGTQVNSFWALVNDSWQLQGMDTGYHDSDLLDVASDDTHLRLDEAAWHQQQLAGAGSRTVILFSHHQLFSTFEPIGKVTPCDPPRWQNAQLLANLKAWQGVTPNIVAWMWGHEHVLEVYEVPGTLPILGRCVGNGAFPVFTDSSGYKPNPDSGVALEPAKTSPDGSITFPNGFVQTQPDALVWASGYTMLELPNTGAATASYYQVEFNGSVAAATSQLLWKESIPAAATS